MYEVKGIVPLTRPVLYCSLSEFAGLVKFYHIYQQFNTYIVCTFILGLKVVQLAIQYLNLQLIILLKS